jgi:hypothetical protein
VHGARPWPCTLHPAPFGAPSENNDPLKAIRHTAFPKYVLQHISATGISLNKLILNFLSCRQNKGYRGGVIFFAGEVADIRKMFLPCAPNFGMNNRE